MKTLEADKDLNSLNRVQDMGHANYAEVKRLAEDREGWQVASE